MKKLIGILGIAIAATLSVAFLAGASHYRAPDVATTLSTLRELMHCEYACEVTPCGGTGHQLKWGELGNADQYRGGHEHPCFEALDCSPYHDCPPHGNTDLALAIQAVDRILELIPEIPGQQLLAMDETEPNLLLNMERQAIQVLGCEGLVVASVEITPDQRADLVSTR
jgi:hypothetical protein